MNYNTNLKWLSQFHEFSPEQQKVLLALSNEQYKWRAKDRLRAVTALEPDVLDSTLAQLLKRNIVRPSFSKRRNIIFGLRERVDTK